MSSRFPILALAPALALDRFLELPFHEFLRLHTDKRRHRLPTFEDEETGNAHDIEFSGNSHVLIHIHLGYFHFAFVLFGEFLHYREHRLAWSTPRRPEIDEHWGRALQNFGIKCSIGDIHDHIVEVFLKEFKH